MQEHEKELKKLKKDEETLMEVCLNLLKSIIYYLFFFK